MCDASIDGFIQLIARYRPDFPEIIKGASVAQIDASIHLGLARKPSCRDAIYRV
ncbi:MAG: hypothetical protein RMY36_006955 [Nostoc sp. SerVER01]